MRAAWASGLYYTAVNLAYCRDQLATDKCPRSVDFVDELPRQDNGKLYKRELRERYWEGRDSRIV